MSDTAFSHVTSDAYGGFSYEEAMRKLFADGGSDLAQHAAFRSDDAGRTNDVYGAVLWNQSNTSTPLYGLFPKIDGTSADVDINNPRPQTFRAAFGPPQMDTPPEGGSWGEAATFETREVKATPHHSQMKFEGTILQQIESQLQDDVPLDDITALGENYWQLRFETQGLARAIAGSNSGTSTPQYDADNALTSIDRIVASADEESNATDVNGNDFADGDLDVYTIDRSATGGGSSNESGWADAEVDHNAGGGDRQLTADLVNGMIERLGDNGANIDSTVIYTGRDSGRVLSDLRAAQFRFAGDGMPSSSGVDEGDSAQTRSGVPTNTRISHWDGIPIVEGQNVPSDSLSRIYMLDLSTMVDEQTNEQVPKFGIETYLSPIVETAGPGQPTNTLAIDNLADEVGYLTTHEPVCRQFRHQGKIRDLAE